MTSIDLIRGDYDDMYLPDQFELPRQGARYTIDVSVGEQDKPEIALTAQRIHGKSYVEYGYIAPEGLTEDGRLLPELDGNRDRADGSVRVNYLIARETGKSVEEARATVRLIDIGENGTVEDLPTYRYFKDVFSSETKTKLHNIIELYGKGSIREIGALGVTDARGHLGSYELMRATMQNALIKEAEYGHRELFLVSMTKKSLRPITEFAGKNATTLLSEPTEMFSDDPRKVIHISPALIDPHKIIDGILDDIEASDSPAKVVTLSHKLQFFADGLPAKCIGSRAARFLADAA